MLPANCRSGENWRKRLINSFSSLGNSILCLCDFASSHLLDFSAFASKGLAKLDNIVKRQFCIFVRDVARTSEDVTKLVDLFIHLAVYLKLAHT